MIEQVVSFIDELQWQDLPISVRHQAKRCLLDTIGCAIGARQTQLSRIMYDFAAQMHNGKTNRLWLDGRQVSALGAVLAHGTTIDALDIHDNCNMVKGHAGVAIIPTVLAMVEQLEKQPSGQEVLTSIVVGYEIAIRAGLALHAAACDYHSSGAWNALGCAAVAARYSKLDAESTRHALGIAEYHGPRSQMMRCIDTPTMLKDGSGWGAMTGLSAAWMAHSGFTGAPAITVESEAHRSIWDDIGIEWHISHQDFKRYAVCHWAQPAIASTLQLIRIHHVSPRQIREIRVFTFHEATRLNNCRPQNTEQAQYSLPFPVAAAVFHNHLGPSELSGAALENPDVLRLAESVRLVEDDECNARFPEQQTAYVEIELMDGKMLNSEWCFAPWDILDIPATDDELQEKFHWLVGGNLPEERARTLGALLWGYDDVMDAQAVFPLLLPADVEKINAFAKMRGE
uniref:2-methylcitrate dehydratase PrpD n=1 Tax=Candidatus Kentrum sp. LPFa TaxID=2126335 RepID=A0A450VM33_9GAMM|nr:MAG: 2-methylcitrate dehydratase PrpD [Candidatus Kentron sp. LPFa]